MTNIFTLLYITPKAILSFFTGSDIFHKAARSTFEFDGRHRSSIPRKDWPVYTRSFSLSFSRGENKNKFSHTYALLESKDNSLAGRGSVSLRNERFYRGYRDRAGPLRSCIITPLLSDGLLYIRSPCMYIHIYIYRWSSRASSWLCARRRAPKSAPAKLLSCPPLGLDKNSRCASAEPSSLRRGIRSYPGICVEKRRKRGSASMTLSTRDWILLPRERSFLNHTTAIKNAVIVYCALESRTSYFGILDLDSDNVRLGC